MLLITVSLALPELPAMLKIPPPELDELPLTVQLLTVNTDWKLIMPPPLSVLEVWPLVMVRPEILTVAPFTRKTLLVELGKFPSTARLAGPGPLMLRSLVMSNSTLVRMIVPDIPASYIVSPLTALA